MQKPSECLKPCLAAIYDCKTEDFHDPAPKP